MGHYKVSKLEQSLESLNFIRLHSYFRMAANWKTHAELKLTNQITLLGRGGEHWSWRATVLQSLAPTLIKHTWS